MNKRILVVEDESIVFRWLDEVLANRYELEWTQTAHEALRRSLDRTFDAVILDFNVADIDCWKALDWFCRLHPFVPVVVITYAQNQIARATAIGASAVLEKPVDEREFRKTMEWVLSDSHRQYLWSLADSRYGVLRVPEPSMALRE